VRVALFVATLTLVGVEPALACSIIASEQRLIGPTPATTLLARSAFVEVVVAESAEPLGADDLVWPSPPSRQDMDRAELGLRQMSAHTIRFRVIERLQGDGPNGFTLRGQVDSTDPTRIPQLADLCGDFSDRRGECLGDWLDEEFTPDLLWNSCFQPPFVTLGARYLIFRDADGTLTDPSIRIRSSGRRLFVRGPVMRQLIDDDPWLAAVRQELAEQQP
jgi:hypothetical protein